MWGAAALGLIAAVLAWPVPSSVSRASWPTRSPVVALLLWQSIALAGGLAMIGALALLGTALLPDSPWAAALPAVVLTLYLLAQLVVTMIQVTRERRRHLVLLDLLTSPHPTRLQTRVIDNEVPVAYCLPRGAGSVTVLSQGLLDRLDPEELRAVIAHERAHVEQRHDLLLLAFRAWRCAWPWFPMAVRAEVEVAALVEMLADDRARRQVRDQVLARAILRVGASGVPRSQAAVAGPARVGDRFRRLAGPSSGAGRPVS